MRFELTEHKNIVANASKLADPYSLLSTKITKYAIGLIILLNGFYLTTAQISMLTPFALAPYQAHITANLNTADLSTKVFFLYIYFAA